MITITLDTNQSSHLKKFIRLAEQLKVSFQVLPDGVASEEAEDYADFIAAIEWSNAKQRGEILDDSEESINDFLDELQIIAKTARQNENSTITTI